jgi:hypothetical protein
MNIFFLDINILLCSKYHCSKHVIKMILESVQLLCSSHYIHPTKNYTPPYKLTHKNHPGSIWVRKSLSNYKWLCELTIELCKEYTFRYGKIHKCEKDNIIQNLIKNPPNIDDLGFTDPPQCMPIQYKNKDAVQAYRDYYFYEKKHILNWNGKINNRNTPRWYIDKLISEMDIKELNLS